MSISFVRILFFCPEAIMFPFFKHATWVIDWTISSIWCVTYINVCLSRARELTICKNSSLEVGSSPFDGSSRISISGFDIIALAISIRRFSPSEAAKKFLFNKYEISS